MALGKLDVYMKKNELDSYLTSHTKINSKCINLTIRPETVKLIEENTRHNLLDIDLGDGF